MFGVSRNTLYNIRQQLGVSDDDGQQFSQISDEGLQEHVQADEHMPDTGQSLIRRNLRERGIHAQYLIYKTVLQLLTLSTQP